MSNDLAWKIVATPANRFALAIFLMHRDLTFKTRKEQRRLHRARQALGLYAPTDAFTGDKQGRIPFASNREQRNLFTVTSDVAEFVTDCLDRLEVAPAPGQGQQTAGLSAVQLAQLEPVVQQLEDQGLAKEEVSSHADAEEWDESKEDWSVSSRPVVDQPDKLVDVFAECVRAAGGDFSKFGQLFLEQLSSARPGKPEGKLASESAPTASPQPS